MGISKADLVDADVYDATELNTDGSIVYLSVTVVSTTSGTQTVVVNLASDGEGILYSKDHPVEVGDSVDLTGTSGGLGNGTFTITAVLTDTSFTVAEPIGTSTGGTAFFRYPPGAQEIGYRSSDQNSSSGSQLQRVVTDISNATLLDDEPGSFNTTYTITRVGPRVTQELWVNTISTFAIKRIAYTYSANRLTQEVRKVYLASDGTTIIAQKTISYSYSGITPTGSVITRDI